MDSAGLIVDEHQLGGGFGQPTLSGPTVVMLPSENVLWILLVSLSMNTHWAETLERCCHLVAYRGSH